MDWYIELYSENAGNKTLSSENRNLPSNWRDFAFLYQRSEKYSGVFRSVTTDNISFVKDGKTFLDNIINTYGVTENVRVLIWHKVGNSAFSVFYRGILDLTTYESDDIFFKCKIIDSDYVQKFRTREDLQIDISRTTTIDGDTIAAHTWKDLTLTPRGIVIDGESQSLAQDNGTAGDPIYLTPNQINVNEGLIAMNLMGQDYYYQAYTYSEIVSTILTGSFQFDQSGLGFTLTFEVDITHYNDTGTEIATNTVYTTTSSDDTGTISFTATEQEYTLSDGDYLAAYINVYRAGGAPAPVIVNYLVNGISAAVSTTERTQSSTVKFDLPFPLFKRALYILTGKNNTLESTILGSALDGYTSNGAAWNYGILNGYMLRDVNKYPTFSFSDLFASYAALFNIGLGFERSGGARVARIEEKEYFYQRSTVVVLDKVTDFKRTYADGSVYNSISVGYEDVEYNEFGGQREFNQKLNFADKLQIKAELNLISPFRADGLGMELQRRLDNRDDDTDADKDNFIIDVKNDSGYTNRTPSDAGITSVTGTPDPDTVYNITISPRHNLLRWGNWLRSGLDKFKTESVTFTGSEKDINLSYTEDGNSITEAADITISDFARPIFEPEIYSFNCPLSSAQINTIEANPNGIIKFNYDGVNYYGFLNKMTVKVDDKTAQFELLKAYKYID